MKRTRQTITATLVGLLLVGGAFAFRCHAEEAIELGKEALSETEEFPWYDAQDDQLRAAKVPVTRQQEGPYEWELWTPDVKLETNSGAGWGSTFLTVLKVSAYTFLALILVGLVAFLIRAYLRIEIEESPALDAGGADITYSDEERIENLPFPVEKRNGDFLESARRFYDQGDYRQAIVYLFSYLLVQLDKGGRIHLARGKTNRQYLSELRSNRPLSEVLQLTMFAFEDVFFGGHDLSAKRFQRCWDSLDEFHRQMEAPQ